MTLLHRSRWHRHPAVVSGDALTLGERAADRMRNGMGSWWFVFGALVFLAAWMLDNRNHGFDRYPFILLNLVLSCVAALQGAILLIAAKRSDHIASQLAEHDFETDQRAAERIEELHGYVAALLAANESLLDQQRVLLERLPADPCRAG
jgi:uncharacterized membrane protein